MIPAMPARYPTSTGLLSRSANSPRRSSQPTAQQAATRNANAAAASAFPAVAAAPMAAAVIRAVVLSGPTLSWRLEPRTAYRVSPPTAAHRPTSGGTPASSAYAITCGTRYAVTVTPASTSPRSQPLS